MNEPSPPPLNPWGFDNPDDYYDALARRFARDEPDD